ncbi:MAG: MFS transporter [Thermomicrobiales bacterium]
MTRAFVSLRIPQFRILWFGMLFSIGAMQIDLVARAWLAYDLTGSGLALGLVTASRGLPQIILSPFGGVAADRFDKRRLLVYSQSAVFVLASVNAFLVVTGLIEVWHLAVLGLLQGFTTPFTMPTRTALVPDLVPEDQIPNALALESTGRNINRIVSPALAGVLLAITPGLAFIAIAIVYGAAVATHYTLPRGLRGAGSKKGAFGDMADGFRYIFSRAPLFALIGLAFIPILLGMPFQSLLPVFQLDVLHISESQLGLMYTAVGVGAIIGSVVVAYLSNSEHIGRLQMGSGIVFGLTLTLFAMSTTYALSMVLLVVVGFFSTGYLTFNRMLVAMHSERAVFGRVMAIYGMTWSLMPIALLPFGALVDVFGVQTVVATAGVAVAIIVAAAAAAFSGQLLSSPASASAPGD